MARILFVFGTEEGHTLDLTRRVMTLAGDLRHICFRASARELYVTLDEDRYGTFITSASVHFAKHQAAVEHFVRDNLELLNSTPSAFFQ